MAVEIKLLPSKIFLADFKGAYERYIEELYKVFKRDFMDRPPFFGKHQLRLKKHPLVQGRAYTFYHMTHCGSDEKNRIPDMRRCECLPWGKPTIEKVTEYSLRFWPQTRRGKNRICIWLETDTDEHYFFILDVRKNYILPWTAFVAEHDHQIEKKRKEYQGWLADQHGQVYTPDTLVNKIVQSVK